MDNSISVEVRTETGKGVARRLRAEEDVLVIPGTKFGLDGHFRFSSALPDDHLREGLARMNALVGRILADA